MSTVLPTSYFKRSMVYRLQKDTGFTLVDGSAVALGDRDGAGQFAQCGLIDLSPIYRNGARGRQASVALAAAGLPVPDKPNRCESSAKGEQVLRLSASEYWVLGNPCQGNEALPAVMAEVQRQQDCYSLYCQHSHAWFALGGKVLPELMAKICGVDMRPAVFPVGSVAQTSVGRVNAIVAHHMLGNHQVFSILSDNTSSEYLWQVLEDAMAEYEGKVVGLNALD